MAGTLVGNSRPSDPEAVSNPIEKFSGYRVRISIGTSKPPSERIVNPEPANVNTAQMATVAIAIPPGTQLNSAVNTRSNRRVAPPCTMKYPARVNSGIEGSSGDATSRYISTGTEAAGVPAFQNRSSARPPKAAKIGNPSTIVASSTIKEMVSTPAVAGGIAKPNTTGSKVPREANALPFQAGLACRIPR